MNRESKLLSLLTFRNVFLLGLIICLATTLYDVLQDKQWNFYIFKLATLDFWNGVMPYGEQWFRHGYDYYLYSPTFNVLFTPFAYIPYPFDVFVWNYFNYLLLAYAIYSFPKVDIKRKTYTLLFLIPILAPSMMSCQYNIGVAAMFVLAFTLMEREKYFWAIVVIMISGVTKIYGIAELAILLFYPRFWRNIWYAVIVGALLVALPLLKLSLAEYSTYLTTWLGGFEAHKSSRYWETIYDISFIPWNGMRYELMPYIQVGAFVAVIPFVLATKRLWGEFSYRIGVVAAIMGWCILFGNSSETHTYLISVTGFLLWYHSLSSRTKTLRWLYWLVLVFIALMPIDLIFPMPVLEFCYHTLHINKFLMLFVWLYMLVHILFNYNYRIGVQCKR